MIVIAWAPKDSSIFASSASSAGVETYAFIRLNFASRPALRTILTAFSAFFPSLALMPTRRKESPFALARAISSSSALAAAWNMPIWAFFAYGAMTSRYSSSVTGAFLPPCFMLPRPVQCPISIVSTWLAMSPSSISLVNSFEKPAPTTFAPSRSVQSIIFILITSC